MKKNVIKTAVAAVCVVAAGMGGLKAYNVANQSKAELLLAENIDAFSAEPVDIDDNTTIYTKKCIPRSMRNAHGSLVTYVCKDGTKLNAVKSCGSFDSFSGDAGWMYCWTLKP